MTDDLSGPHVVVADVVDDLPQLLDRDGLPAEQYLCRVRIAQDRAQRLVDLVRDRRGKLAYHGEPGDVSEPLIGFLDPLAIRHIHQRADHPQRLSPRIAQDEAPRIDINIRAVRTPQAILRVASLAAAMTSACSREVTRSLSSGCSSAAHVAKLCGRLPEISPKYTSPFWFHHRSSAAISQS